MCFRKIALAQLYLAVLGIAALVAPTLLAREQAGEPRVDPAVMSALLRQEPGTYVVSGRQLAAARGELPIPLFVQADVDHGPQGLVRVPVVVGTEGTEPWAVQLRIASAGTLPAGERANTREATVTGEPGRVRQIREFTLAPGNYEVVAAIVRGRFATVTRQALAVPNPSANMLVAGPVVLGESAVPWAAADTRGRAFSFANTSLMPAAVNRFRQSDNLHIALRLFGWKRDNDAKPDVTVEYVFQERFGNQARFFNKTKPQELNAKTLSRAFDATSGALATGITVPLAAFPPGEFQVVVRIRDKRTQASTVQTARFTVTPS